TTDPAARGGPPRGAHCPPPPADLAPRLVERPVQPGVQHGWPVELGPLLDLDRLPERDASVPPQRERQWTRRRAGRRVLGDAAARREHACLPVLALPREGGRAPG